jgi:hypothetical protein
MYQEQVDKYNIQSLRSGTTQQPWTPNITSHTKTLRILAASFVTYLFIASLCFAQASGAADSLSVLFLTAIVIGPPNGPGRSFPL